MAILWRPLLVFAVMIAILVLIVLELFSCGGGDDGHKAAAAKTQTTPSASVAKPAVTPTTTTAKRSGPSIAASALKVGDCVGDARSTVGDVTTFAAVGCDKRHDGEVYTLIVLRGANYPGVAAVTAKGQRGCRARLRRHVVVGAFGVGELGFKFVYPTTKSWAGGDREIRCMATFKTPRSEPLPLH
jgi:hypothetical protein